MIADFLFDKKLKWNNFFHRKFNSEKIKFEKNEGHSHIPQFIRVYFLQQIAFKASTLTEFFCPSCEFRIREGERFISLMENLINH